MKSALYSRVPTSEQTTENHRRELTEACQKHGWDIVQVFEGAGVRGTKGRDARPAFNALCKAVARREADIVAAWSVDRIGRPKGTVQLPKSMVGKFSDVTGNSLPGIAAAVTTVERGRSNPLYEFFKSGVALWGRQHQRAVDAAWREALTNPHMARTMSSALELK